MTNLSANQYRRRKKLLQTGKELEDKYLTTKVRWELNLAQTHVRKDRLRRTEWLVYSQPPCSC